jgi:hypothetical protein
MSINGTLARLLIATVLLVLAFPWASGFGEKESPTLFPIRQEEKWGFYQLVIHVGIQPHRPQPEGD